MLNPAVLEGYIMFGLYSRIDQIVTAQAKPKPQLSQIRLGLELGNASVSTHHHHHPTQTLNSLYLRHFSTDCAEILHDYSLPLVLIGTARPSGYFTLWVADFLLAGGYSNLRCKAGAESCSDII